MQPRRSVLKRASGSPLALLLFILPAFNAPAQAQPDRAPSALGLAGQPVAALAAHPDVAGALDAVPAFAPVLIAGSLYFAGEVLRLNDEVPD